MSQSKLPIPKRKLAGFCQRNHIRDLALFASVLTDDFRPGSDIDVLVEIEPGRLLRLRFLELQEELSNLFGGPKVDLLTRQFLNQGFRKEVLQQAEVSMGERASRKGDP